MSSSKSTGSSNVPLFRHFELGEGMQLQVNVGRAANGGDKNVVFQLKNCTRSLILHWGGIYHGQTNWVLPSHRPPGTRTYNQSALQTPFSKSGEIFLITIAIQDSKLCAIEFVLKDEAHNRWWKLNQGNFRVDLPRDEEYSSFPSIPEELVKLKAFMLWESKGKPKNSPQQEKENYKDALKELQDQLSRGISLDELRNTSQLQIDRRKAENEETRTLVNSSAPSVYRKRHDVCQWLNKSSDAHANGSGFLSSNLLNLVERSISGGGESQRHIFRVGSNELVVLLRTVRGENHILLAVDTKGSMVIHWGVSKTSAGEWLLPPSEVLPDRSQLVDGACQTYFKDMPTAEGSFQYVDINMQQRDFVGISFVLWCGGTWMKNNGSNFYISLRPMESKDKQSVGDVKGIAKGLLNEISKREIDAERSLMHRYNIASELIEPAKNEGQLGLIGILIWLRFMAMRQLTWNRNYNVKPREISSAQDNLTGLLTRLYTDQPCNREIVRLIMATIGRGGQGDVGQRIRDEILVLQRNNDCKGGMMEEWHQKLHNNTSPDDVIICQALLDYVKNDFKIDVYWRTLNASGLTRDRLASYDRPIRSEPRFRADSKDGLIRDLTSYLRTLKAVHSGADLDSAIASCLGYSSKGHDFMGGVQIHPVGGLSSKLQESLRFVQSHVEDNNVIPLMENLLESRIELRPLLLKSHGRLKDLIFLDLALDSAVRTSMDRGYKVLTTIQLKDIMYFSLLLLENLCLSSVNNEELIYCMKDWYRIFDSYKPNDEQWPLQAKAVLDRVRLALSDKAQNYQEMIQPSAQYLGAALKVEKWAIDIFTEELIRAGSAASLSLLLNRLDPILRKIANLGCWQVLSPVEVCGFVTSVDELIRVQNKVYTRPTIIISNKVSGEEEIPDGVVAVLTPDMPDVLSHVSVRARSSKALGSSAWSSAGLR